MESDKLPAERMRDRVRRVFRVLASNLWNPDAWRFKAKSAGPSRSDFRAESRHT